MFCSIIIPTVGRPSLSKSVHSALEQDYPDDYEIIVVNDTGFPLPPSDWQTSNRVRVITTQKRERCFARNVGASIAKGKYFCFLDDDDWLLPESLKHFSELTQSKPDAAWLYGGVRFIDEEGKILGYLNQRKNGNCFVEVMTETWIPIQASLVKAEVFFEVGGFDPEFVVTQDLDLLRRVALKHDLANTPAEVACIQRGPRRESVTKYSIGWYFIALGRERLLGEKEALNRLLDSAGNSARMRGFVLRNYIIATLFNIRQRAWSKALSRFIIGVVSFARSLAFVFHPDFYRAVRQTYPLHLDLVRDPSPDYESVEEWLYW
jgi:glycosyltransferase involved in cell wall biosynthesis